jgi:thymidylate synthase ThyX
MSEGKELAKWADKAMWTAEPSEAEKGTRAVLVSANPDPLGEMAALNKMFTGQAVSDLSTITDEERHAILDDIKATVLKMPLETVRLHFLIEGVHRGITHQMVRQRTAAYAQESMRFAVKEDLAQAVALPPSLGGTLSLAGLVAQDLYKRQEMGLRTDWEPGSHEADEHEHDVWLAAINAGGKQAWRLKWDEAVKHISETYLDLVNDGMPAEDARGLTPTNVLTKLHYITNLRSFYDTMGMRVSDQAQYEWRHLIMAMVKAMREYGATQTYLHTLTGQDVGEGGYDFDAKSGDVVRSSSAWQFRALTEAILPVDFALGRRGFGSPFDRASRIGERVDAFAAMGVPSSRWLEGAPEFNIPALRPEEWLLDPDSARINENQEFDIFGQRVTKGTGWHWTKEHGGVLYNDGPNGRQWANLTDGPSYDINDIIKEKSNA